MHKKDYYYNKDNQRGWMLKHKYNITIETYKKLHDAQKGLCAICLNPEQSIHRIFLAVDHDHKTGKIRGLLCDKCNRGLGQFKDNIEILEQAIKYLKSGVEENLNVLQ